MAQRMREAVTSGWASMPSFTLHMRPDASLTSYPGLVPVVLKATNWYWPPVDGGFNASPPGPRYKSRVARSAGSCHSMAGSKSGSVDFCCASGAYAHATSATTITTKRKGADLIIRPRMLRCKKYSEAQGLMLTDVFAP